MACLRFDVMNADFWVNALVFLVWESNLRCEYVHVHMWIKPTLINSRRDFQRKFHLQEGRSESVHGHRDAGPWKEAAM